MDVFSSAVEIGVGSSGVGVGALSWGAALVKPSGAAVAVPGAPGVAVGVLPGSVEASGAAVDAGASGVAVGPAPSTAVAGSPSSPLLMGSPLGGLHSGGSRIDPDVPEETDAVPSGVGVLVLDAGAGVDSSGVAGIGVSVVAEGETAVPWAVGVAVDAPESAVPASICSVCSTLLSGVRSSSKIPSTRALCTTVFALRNPCSGRASSKQSPEWAGTEGENCIFRKRGAGLSG